MQDRILDAWIREWAEEEARAASKAGWPSISPIWRVRFSPGLATQASEHKILSWPKTKIIAKISRASHQLTPTDRLALIQEARAIIDDDGKPLTNEVFCMAFKISQRKLGAYVNRAKTKLRKILSTYE